MKATWSKSDKYGWRVRLEDPGMSKGDLEGAKVVVERKDGTNSVETINKVVWSGENDDGKKVYLATIVPKPMGE